MTTETTALKAASPRPQTVPGAGRPHVAVIGAGPAGLAAAEVLAPYAKVDIFERLPAPGPI
ncbi:MAG: NAD(P)-binding protein [Pseudomonadales bacterium]